MKPQAGGLRLASGCVQKCAGRKGIAYAEAKTRSASAG
jgi:hypothetical protein